MDDREWDLIDKKCSTQVSAKLRRGRSGYFHWCEACQQLHPLPDKWFFDGNVDQPTFSPSFKQHLPRNRICHYIITAGQIAYCSDSSHALAGKTAPIADLPAHLQGSEE